MAGDRVMAEYNGDLYAFSDVRFQRHDERSIVIAYLLWFFLGALGAHRFYLGYNSSGIAMALLLPASIVIGLFTLSFTIFWTGLLLLSLWVLADAFMIPFLAR